MAAKDALEARLEHPILGSIGITFLLWNWQLLFWFLGAVTSPKESVQGACSYFLDNSNYFTFLPPIAIGTIYAFAGPFLASVVYRRFELLIERTRATVEGKAKGIQPVAGIYFNNTMSTLRAKHALILKSKDGLAKVREDLSSHLGQAFEGVRHLHGDQGTTARAEIRNAQKLLNDIAVIESALMNSESEDHIKGLEVAARGTTW